MRTTPDADAFLDGEGHRAVFEAMVEHDHQVVPDLWGFSIHRHSCHTPEPLARS